MRYTMLASVMGRILLAVAALLSLYLGWQTAYSQTSNLGVANVEWAALFRKVPERIKKLSLHYRCESSTDGSKEPTFLTTGSFAWNVQNDQFFSQEVQYRHNNDKDPKHWVINVWDGSVASHWARYIDPSVPGNRLIGNAPEDPGTLVLQARTSWGSLGHFKEALGLMDYGDAQQAIIKNAKVTVRSDAPPDLPPGKVVRFEGAQGIMEIHVPTGWVIIRKFNWDNGLFLQIQLSGFRKIPSSELYFPTTLVRSMPDGKGGEGKTTIQIDPVSVRFDEKVKFPTVNPPSGTSIQDQRSGAFKTVP